MSALLDRMSIDAATFFGGRLAMGMRIQLALNFEFLAIADCGAGKLAHRPRLEPGDVRATIAYPAGIARERFVSVPARSALPC